MLLLSSLLGAIYGRSPGLVIQKLCYGLFQNPDREEIRNCDGSRQNIKWSEVPFVRRGAAAATAFAASAAAAAAADAFTPTQSPKGSVG